MNRHGVDMPLGEMEAKDLSSSKSYSDVSVGLSVYAIVGSIGATGYSDDRPEKSWDLISLLALMRGILSPPEKVVKFKVTPAPVAGEKHKITPQTVKQESEEEHKIEFGDNELKDRLYWTEVQAAEQKMDEWMKNPSLRRKWVVVRDGDPIMPSDDIYDVVETYRARYGERPRYITLVGTAEERSIDIPLL